jgi:hypothetical protein
MKDPIPHLTFKCSKKFSEMEPDSNGRFCSDCQISVKDFRTSTSEQILDEATSKITMEKCGNFYAFQLEKPFGNWKDRVIGLYQNFIKNQNRFGVLRPVLLFFISSLLIMTGCRSKQLAGAYAYDYDSSGNNRKHKKEVQKEKPSTNKTPN